MNLENLLYIEFNVKMMTKSLSGKVNKWPVFTKISNMYKTMKVNEQTHTNLKVFASKRGLSLGEAIDLLLEKNKEISDYRGR